MAELVKKFIRFGDFAFLHGYSEFNMIMKKKDSRDSKS